MRASEPCLCGDPLCLRCFPQTNEAYARDMERDQLRAISNLALNALAYVAGGHPLADDARARLSEAIDTWRGESA